MQIFEIVGDVQGKNILLLQGPMGYFFNHLDHTFMRHGAKTYRIGLNAADQFFADATHYTPYKGRPEEWGRFIEDFFQDKKIDMIFLFGDCRFYQSTAIAIAKTLNIRVFVFEEGYIRPDFITLEENGVNEHSSLPRDRAFYDALEYSQNMACNNKNIKSIGNTYTPMAFQAIAYYLIADFFRFQYPFYQHHRVLSSILEALYGIRNFIRKHIYKITEFGAIKKFETVLSKKYYFVPLQTCGDFQVTQHSKYNSVEEFILEVLTSFCQHAPKDSYLVIKHHPMDRGKKNYHHFIQEHAKKMECCHRIEVIHDVHLPTLLKHAIGTITINSTVGISSLYHHTPTICLGKAIYDIEGLTSKKLTLDQFWNDYQEVDKTLFDKYRCYLIEKTQINGSFYKNS